MLKSLLPVPIQERILAAVMKAGLPENGKLTITVEANFSCGGLGNFSVEASCKETYRPKEVQV